MIARRRGRACGSGRVGSCLPSPYVAFSQVNGGNHVEMRDTGPAGAPMEAVAGQPIRVCMVCGPGEAEVDGVGDYVERLTGALGDAGVCATTVPVRPAGAGWWRATWRAAREVARMRPDVVHVQFAPAAYRFSGVPGVLPLLLPVSVPLVVTVHEYGSWSAPSWMPDAVWRAVERMGAWDRETGRLVPSGGAVIVTNAEHAEQVRARTGRCPTEIPLAPNVADHGDSPDARRRTRDALGVAPEDLLLVFFGFVHPVKGVRYLLKSLAELRTRRPGVRLLVVGGFTSQALPEAEARRFRAELEGLAHRYGVADAVAFTGYLPAPEASRMLHAADMAVLPYTAGVTAKSGALLTALAHGLPTAVTLPDAPAHRTVPACVEVIAARRNAAAITRAVERLADNPALCHHMAADGRAFAARHSWSRVALAHRAVYEDLLGRHPDVGGPTFPAGRSRSPVGSAWRALYETLLHRQMSVDGRVPAAWWSWSWARAGCRDLYESAGRRVDERAFAVGRFRLPAFVAWRTLYVTLLSRPIAVDGRALAAWPSWSRVVGVCRACGGELLGRLSGVDGAWARAWVAYRLWR